jgi:hypothetical protein
MIFKPMGMTTAEFTSGDFRWLCYFCASFCDAREPLLARWAESDFELLVSPAQESLHVYM